MKSLRTLQPGQPGTKKLVQEYGEKLYCVRYRYDSITMKRITTAEIIVAEEDWKQQPDRIPMNKIVNVRVHYGEIELGVQVKASGGYWNPQKKLWQLPYQEVVALGLTDRVVPEKRSKKNV
ncbi:hypothetical protein JW960_20635 [candidate division KSB1 bacterium]|nr:hypothetical protein [candidate division KSB1 bacterium]